MPYYTVTIEQQREWQDVIKADTPEEAKSLAHLEANLDYIVCEQTYCEELHEE